MFVNALICNSLGSSHYHHWEYSFYLLGKTMENVRKHLDVHLVQSRKQLHKLTKKPTFARCRIFDQDLVAVEMKRAKVKLYKPSYSGMCILDISKYAYDFYYNYLKTKYGANLQLMMTDTDSLLFSVQCKDIYNDMSENMELFDTSDYPETHFLHSVENKKVLGKMKDETNGVPIREFVGLRSKMYRFVFGKGEKKKPKGISKGSEKEHSVWHAQADHRVWKKFSIHHEPDPMPRSKNVLRTVKRGVSLAVRR